MSTISSRDGAAAGEQVVGGDQDPGRAEAALERVVALEGLLQRREHRVAGERLDGLDLGRRPPAPRAGSSARTATPSSRTVQAPQTPCSQPTCVPVSPSRWRRKSVSSSRGSTSLDDDAAVHRDGDLGHAARSQARSSARSTSVAGEVPEIGGETRGSSPAGRRRRAASAPASRADAAVSGGAAHRLLDLGRAPSAGRSTAPTRIRTSRATPSTRRSTTATIASAKSPARSASSSNAHPRPRPARGQAVSTTSSPGRERRQVVGDEEVLGVDLPRPAGPSTTTVPPSAARQSGISAAPSACATLPPTVPRFRVTKWPTYGSASRRSGWVRGSRVERRLAHGRADPRRRRSPSTPVEAGAG